MATGGHDSLQKLTECPICMAPYTSPKLLPCGHVFCVSCLDQTHQTDLRAGRTSPDRVLCPICRGQHPLSHGGVKALPNDFRANDMKDLVDKLRTSSQKPTNDVSCSMCDSRLQETDTNSFCFTCVDAMCQSCSESHHRIPSHSNHVYGRAARWQQQELETESRQRQLEERQRQQDLETEAHQMRLKLREEEWLRQQELDRQSHQQKIVGLLRRKAEEMEEQDCRHLMAMEERRRKILEEHRMWEQEQAEWRMEQEERRREEEERRQQRREERRQSSSLCGLM